MDPARPPSDDRPAQDWAEVVLALGLITGLVVILSLSVDGGPQPPLEVEPAEGLLRQAVRTLALVAEAAAALVIGWGVLQAVGAYALRVVRPGGDAVNSTESLRLRLGRVLALGIEFTLAADILATAVAPTRADLLKLGAVVLLRTLLNLFLEREIREGEAKRAQAAPASPPLDDAPA